MSKWHVGMKWPHMDEVMRCLVREERASRAREGYDPTAPRPWERKPLYSKKVPRSSPRHRRKAKQSERLVALERREMSQKQRYGWMWFMRKMRRVVREQTTYEQHIVPRPARHFQRRITLLVPPPSGVPDARKWSQEQRDDWARVSRTLRHVWRVERTRAHDPAHRP